MDKSPERRDTPRVELFPLWEERDIHRVWLFHKDEPGIIFGLLINLSMSGGCLILHNPDQLPPAFRLSLQDQHGKSVLVFELRVTEQWHQPYFAGFVKVGFRCVPLSNSLAWKIGALAKPLASGEIEFLRTRIEPL